MASGTVRCDHCGQVYRTDELRCPHCLAPMPERGNADGPDWVQDDTDRRVFDALRHVEHERGSRWTIRRSHDALRSRVYDVSLTVPGKERGHVPAKALFERGCAKVGKIRWEEDGPTESGEEVTHRGVLVVSLDLDALKEDK